MTGRPDPDIVVNCDERFDLRSWSCQRCPTGGLYTDAEAHDMTEWLVAHIRWHQVPWWRRWWGEGRPPYNRLVVVAERRLSRALAVFLAVFWLVATCAISLFSVGQRTMP